MKKTKNDKILKFSYRQRYKNQAKTIRQLRDQLEFYKEDKELLNWQIADLKEKCRSLEADLDTSNEIKGMYFNALNVQTKLDETKRSWWKRVLKIG